jgi:hypothetical protein
MKRLHLMLMAAMAALTITATSPALAGSTIANLTITTAQAAATTSKVQVREGSPESITIQCNFTYGSGGTSADAWVQTSIDGGTTWVDIAECGFTTSSAKKVYNLSGLTPVTSVYTPTDGTLAANTSKDGIVANWFRVKYTTVGTYAGGTTLSIDVSPNRSRLQ